MGWRWHVEGMNNRIHHAIQVLQHVFIGKAHYTETLRNEKVLAVFVSLTFVRCAVGRPINFDNEAFSETHKINHKRSIGACWRNLSPTPLSCRSLPQSLLSALVLFRRSLLAISLAIRRYHSTHPTPTPPRQGEGSFLYRLGIAGWRRHRNRSGSRREGRGRRRRASCRDRKTLRRA